jgi:hypothetical protein
MRIRLEKVSPKVEDPMGPHGFLMFSFKAIVFGENHKFWGVFLKFRPKF